MTMPRDQKAQPNGIIRAIRLELTKPLSEPWDEAGPTMRMLASATPKLMNAAYDALAACRIAGTKLIKQAVCPDTKGASADAIAYQAVTSAAESMRSWKPKGSATCPYADLDVSGSTAAAISRAASQAFARRDQGRVSFSSPRIIVPKGSTTPMVILSEDERGVVLSLKIRRNGLVRFACARSDGSHRNAISRIIKGEWRHGDAKIQYDEERKKWYALLSYEMPKPEPAIVDPRRVLSIHRGIRNALYPLCATTEYVKPLRGEKLHHQRGDLKKRQWSVQKITSEELGMGAKGRGRARRYERSSIIEDKIARVTHTWCQQAAAWVANLAVAKGCGLVVIEDYGGIEPSPDRALRRVLDRFPLYELKQAIKSRLENVRTHDGKMVSIELNEVASFWISSKCPRCETVDPSAHNTRTHVFHCRVCGFDRDADFVAAYWMLRQSGRADMSEWDRKFEIERRLAMSTYEEAAQ